MAPNQTKRQQTKKWVPLSILLVGIIVAAVMVSRANKRVVALMKRN